MRLFFVQRTLSTADAGEKAVSQQTEHPSSSFVPQLLPLLLSSYAHHRTGAIPLARRQQVTLTQRCSPRSELEGEEGCCISVDRILRGPKRLGVLSFYLFLILHLLLTAARKPHFDSRGFASFLVWRVVSAAICVRESVMYRHIASRERCRARGHCSSFTGTSERCTFAAALECLCRSKHDQHSVHQECAHAIPASRTVKLRRAMWMRMHPVERWTSLVDLGRRGAYLIEKPVHLSSLAARDMAGKSSPISRGDCSKTSVLGSADPKVRFTLEATEAHWRLCHALPYAARLHLSVSVLLWIRCLQDVQDTLARVRLPFSRVRRPERYAVADVFPTRLREYWVDAHTTVLTKMSAQLNSTAEQIPAPHTWDAETSETIEDAAREATMTLDAGRVLHGRHQARLSGKTLLHQVQGLHRRASAEDEVGALRAGTGPQSGRRRRRRTLPSASSLAPNALSVESAPASWACLSSLEFASDASRRVPPVSLEPEPLEDAVYHGNDNRGEGCPLNQDGKASPTPIFIYVPLDVHSAAAGAGGGLLTEAEHLVRYCIMAHAAVLSSLFIEGRVVDFCSNHPLVVTYVRWLLEELVLEHFVSASLLAETEVAAYRPYYPPWCWHSLLVLMPPKHCGGYSVVLLRDWAARIVQAAPCSVLVEGGNADAAYVKQLKEEVRLLQGALDAESIRTVKWVDVGVAAPVETSSRERVASLGGSAVSERNSKGKEEANVPQFRPQRGPRASPSLSTLLSEAALSSSRWLDKRIKSELLEAIAHRTSRRDVFLEAVRATLEDRFYACEILYSPTQSCLPPYRFERWVLEQLPGNVRVVGINTSPLDVLYFYPQGVFLSQKVGNAFRYRAVERTVVAKDMTPSWRTHPLRYAATQLKRLSRRWRRRGADVSSGLHAEFSPSDVAELRRAACAPPSTPNPDVAPRNDPQDIPPEASGKENASHALIRERMVEYLAEPSKRTLLGLAVARFFRV
ncbi:hypothetical protein, conserved [Leishmania tarentolae]|uniref:Uncharacterized protein n=1 Tax=Leishmania tarentolae TaxID=5689 RepID=A0A640KS19_LEITA|nr:hypothetical protein, conserved [Leishmania tarentolae]